MPKVSVLVVNWNGVHLLARCLPRVLAQEWTDAEVVVWDNGSTDGSAGWIEAHYPAVRVLRSDRNLGFAGGNNAAIHATDSLYVAMLNNDAEPDPAWLSSLIGAMESAPDVGMCASKMVRADDPSTMDACGIEVDRAGIAWNRYAGEPDRPHETTPYEVFGPCAGAALYRRSMLEQVGSFDESYFAYYEDVDLAWRARRGGWRCLYVPGARVTHRHSSTGREGSPFKGYQIGRNKVWTLIKNYPWPDWVVYLPAIVGYDVAAWGYALLQGDVHPLRGRLAALREWGRVRDQRRIVQSSGQREPLAGLRNPWRMWHQQRALRRQLSS